MMFAFNQSMQARIAVFFFCITSSNSIYIKVYTYTERGAHLLTSYK